MEITSVRIKRYNNSTSKVIGIASIQLDGQLIIHDLKILQLDNKRIVRFPCKKKVYRKLNQNKSGYDEYFGYSDIVHPCTTDLRDKIEKEIFRYLDEEENNNNE